MKNQKTQNQESLPSLLNGAWPDVDGMQAIINNSALNGIIKIEIADDITRNVFFTVTSGEQYRLLMADYKDFATHVDNGKITYTLPRGVFTSLANALDEQITGKECITNKPTLIKERSASFFNRLQEIGFGEFVEKVTCSAEFSGNYSIYIKDSDLDKDLPEALVEFLTSYAHIVVPGNRLSKQYDIPAIEIENFLSTLGAVIANIQPKTTAPLNVVEAGNREIGRSDILIDVGPIIVGDQKKAISKFEQTKEAKNMADRVRIALQCAALDKPYQGYGIRLLYDPVALSTKTSDGRRITGPEAGIIGINCALPPLLVSELSKRDILVKKSDHTDINLDTQLQNVVDAINCYIAQLSPSDQLIYRESVDKKIQQRRQNHRY